MIRPIRKIEKTTLSKKYNKNKYLNIVFDSFKKVCYYKP